MKDLPLLPGNCIGCGACIQVCPSRAVEWKISPRGFLTAGIDVEKCSRCGRCMGVCPLLTIPKGNSVQRCCKAVNYDAEALAISTSGGIFHALAVQTLQRHGVVCAARFDEDFSVKHDVLTSEAGIAPYCGSKYLQSKTGDVFLRIKDRLQRNQAVLFVGTPCQVAGLKNFLGQPDHNLLTVDFVCHGVGPALWFRKFLDYLELRRQSRVCAVNFRSKRRSYHRPEFEARFENGEVFRSGSYENSYTYAFAADLIVGEACMSCPFMSLERPGDLTLADYSGPDVSRREKKYGVSLVLLNTDKGRAAFESLPGVKSSPLDLEQVKRFTYHLTRCSNGNPQRAAFWREAEADIPFEILEKKYLKIPLTVYWGKRSKLVRLLLAVWRRVKRTGRFFA